VMAEGGLGWVPMLADRLDYIVDTSGHGRKAWMSDELRPTEVLLRNFWFCSLDDPSIWPIRDRIGVEHILVEVDYPHSDSHWPNTRDLLAARLSELEQWEIDAVMHTNAEQLFRFEPRAEPRLDQLSTGTSGTGTSGTGTSGTGTSGTGRSGT